MSDKLKIWNAVEKTDPEFTRAMPGQSNLTSINPSYIIKKATELWGSVGDGWGYRVIESRYGNGAPILNNDGQKIVDSVIHTLRVEVWYLNEDGKECTVQHFGHTPLVYKNKYGIQTEPEPEKKSLTDALSKALSMLGFGGDIHMGMYDDSAYVDRLAEEIEVSKAENKAEVISRQQEEYEAWKSKIIEMIKISVNLNELEALYKSAVRKAKHYNDDAFVKIVIEKTNDSKTRLENKDEAV